MGSIGTGYRHALLSFRIVGTHRRLLVLPAISTIAVSGAALAVFGALWRYAGIDGWTLIAIGGAAVGFPFTLLTVFFNVAFLVALDARLRNEDVGVGYGLRAAARRLPAIAGWAAVSTSVGVALQALEHVKVGWLASVVARWAMGIAWTAVTFFVVPVLALESAGPLRSLRRSFRLFRATFGENVGGRVSLGAFAVVPTFLGVGLVCGAGFDAGDGVGTRAVVLAAVGGAILVVTLVVTSAASETLSLALYRYAIGDPLPWLTQLPVPPGGTVAALPEPQRTLEHRFP